MYNENLILKHVANSIKYSDWLEKLFPFCCNYHTVRIIQRLSTVYHLINCVISTGILCIQPLQVKALLMNIVMKEIMKISHKPQN